MANASIFDGIYNSSGMGSRETMGHEFHDYTGVTRPRWSAASNMTPVQPDKWVPLNPALARRYYDMFNRSWVVRTCYQEKIKAGFSGGFGYRYGPGSKKKSSVRNKNSPFGGFETRDEGKGVTGHVVRDSPDIIWIEEALMKGVMYHDMLGIIAFRRKVHPRTKTVKIEVIDLPKGYFVGKIDERGNQEYGWVFNKTVDVIAAGGRRPIPTETSSSSVQHEPDSEVYVYAWPTLEPDIGSPAPFKSIMSTIFLILLENAEMWQNEIEGHYKLTHPTWVTEPDIRTRGPEDMIEHDLMLSVTGQLGPTESMEYYERARLNTEMSVHISRNIQGMNEKNMGDSQRRLGMKWDNTLAVHKRLHSWQDNHYISPIGTKVGKGPEAKLRNDLVNIDNLKATQISAVFGVPIPFNSGARGMSGGSRTTLGSRLEGSTFRNSLVQMRRRVTAFFEEAYMVAIGSLENSTLANMVTELNHESSDTEKLVRMYVRNILTPGGFLLVDEAKTNYEPPIGDPEDGSLNNFRKKAKKKGSPGTSKTIDEYEEGERIDPEKRKIGAELEAEEIREMMEQRKLFTTPDAVIQSQRIDRAGNVILPKSAHTSPGKSNTMYTNALKKKVLGKHTRSVGGAEYEESKRVEKRKRDADNLDPIQKNLEQWKGPHFNGKDVVLFDKYEREKADFMDEQKYLNKLEEARWQKFMEKKNQMDNRVSRIMIMALKDFGIALNPTRVQMALKREIQSNPKLDNTHHRELSEPDGKTREDVLVNEILRGRKKYLNALVDETHRLTIVWNSAPLPDVELLIQASEKGLGIPSEMVGAIITGEQGLEDSRKEYAQKEQMNDKMIERYLKENNLKIVSKTTGIENARRDKKKKTQSREGNKKAKTSSKIKDKDKGNNEDKKKK